MMNWQQYLFTKSRGDERFVFRPETQEEARKALALGIIDIGEYVEFSLSMEPVLDSVHDPDPEVRKKAIQRLADHRDPLSIKLLRDLLLDEEEEVRLYAASELDRIEREFHMRIYHFKNEKPYPTDEENRFYLARIYIEYAETLLRETPLADYFFNKARELLNGLIQQQEKDDYYYFRARCFQHQKDYESAVRDYRKCIALNAGFQQAYFGLAECLFYQDRFADIKRIFRVLPSINREGEAFDAFLYWSEKI